MTESKQRSSAARVPTFKSRVMRRIIPTVILGFAIVAVNATLNVVNASVTRLQNEQRQAVAVAASVIDSAVISSAQQNLLAIAGRRPVREFAALVADRETSSDPFASNLQRTLLADFAFLMGRDSNYLAVRLLTPGTVLGTNSGTSRVWTERFLQAGVIETRTEPYPNPWVNDPAFVRALSETDGVVIFSDVTRVTLSSGGGEFTIYPIVHLYTPITQPSDPDTVIGVLQVELNLQFAVEIVGEQIVAGSDTNNSDSARRLLLLDANGHIVADSADAERSYLLDLAMDERQASSPTSTTTGEYSNNLPDEINDFLAVNPSSFDVQQVGGFVISGRNISLTGPQGSGWRLLIIDETGSLYSGVVTLAIIVVAAVIGTGLLSLLALEFLLRPVLSPINDVAEIVESLTQKQIATTAAAPVAATRSEDDTQTRPASSAVWRPMQELEQNTEISRLLASFSRMTNHIEKMRQSYEEQFERRARNLELAAQISRETVALTDIENLLNRAIELICRQLGFYHAQVFLVDDAREFARLVFSRGEAGRQLLERGHKLAVGSETVVGKVTGQGTRVVVNDTLNPSGEPHRPNPLLPDTRAELGLPLKVGNEVIGVLDIQSLEPNVFLEDELPTYQLLADQLAISIQNARLIAASEERVHQINKLNRQLTRTGWEMVEKETPVGRSYTYNLMEVQPVEEASAPAQDDQALVAPISIRGEVIGTLAASAGEHGFTEGDQMILRAVADRVALALENARLFQQTQTNLAETSRLYQISQSLGEANTLEEITSAVVTATMPDAIGGQIWFFEEYDDQPEVMVVEVDMPLQEREIGYITGMRLNVADHPLIATLNPQQVTLIHDARADSRLDTRLSNLFRQLGAQAVVLIPIFVRDHWHGLLMIEGRAAREFTEREGRIFTNLITQASTAIENRLLMRQTEEALARNENLYSASRIINQAQNEQDLVYAAVATSEDPSLNFALSLLMGELDETGWPTQARVVAQSEGTQINEVNIPHQLYVPINSPMRRRDPEIIVDRNPADPHPTPPVRWLRRQGYRASAVFPLFSANRPIAVFYVYSKEPREFSQRDYEVYKALTGQMSTVLQNRRLLEQTSEALDETRRLYSATSAITSAQDLMDVYRTAVQHIAVFRSSSDTRRGAMGSLNRVSILFARPVARPDAPELEFVYTWTDNGDTNTPYKIGDRISANDAPFGPLTVEANGTINLVRPQGSTTDAPWGIMPGTTQAIVAPLQLRQKWFGVLLCESERPDVFDEQYQRFLQALADQIAIAVENRQLFEEAQIEALRAQEEARRALSLAEAGQFAAQIGRDFEQSVHELFTRVALPAGYDRWLLMLLPETGAQRLVSVVYETPGLADVEQTNLHLELRENEHSLADAVLLNQPLIINNPRQYPAFRQKSESYVEMFVGKHVALPIRSSGKVLGGLLVGRGLDTPDLDDRDQQFITTLAAQIAIALENSRLFAAAEEERRTLNNILETMPVGVLVLDPNTFRVTRFNTQAQFLLGHLISDEKPFDPYDYGLLRTGTGVPYPLDEMPLYSVMETGEAFADDLAVMQDGYQTDLQINATLITNERGEPTAIIAALSDISNLRSLENTLQENLRETVALYEAQNALSGAEDLDDVLDALVEQLSLLQTPEAYVVIGQEDGTPEVVRAMGEMPTINAYLSEVLDDFDLVAIYDVATDKKLSEEARAAFAADNIAALMTVPMRSQGRAQPRGWLVVASSEPREFTVEEQRFFGNLRDIASTVIDNRYLILTTEAALQQTNALYTATTAISRSGGDLYQLGVVLQNALEAYRGDFYAGYLYRDVDRFTSLTELFNINVDGDPLPLMELIEQHGLPDEPRYIEDVRAIADPDPLEADLLALEHIGAVAFITLRAKGLPAGCLIVALREPKPFSMDDRRYFGAIADSASVVVDNVMLFEEIQSTLEETSTLYQASRALTQVTSPEDLLNVIVDFLRGDYVSQVFVALLTSPSWESNSASVRVTASWSEDGILNLSGITLAADQFPAWSLLSSELVVTVDDIYAEDNGLSEGEIAGVASLDARSLVILPLRVTNRAIGAIWMGSTEPHHFTESEQRIFQSFSEQASLSLEAIYLLQQTERRATQLETSAAVSHSAGTILDLKVLLPRVVNLIRDAFGYDHVQVFLMDEADDYAVLQASTGEAGQQLLSIGHKLQKGSQSVIGQVTLRGEPVLALDTAEAGVVHRPNPYLPLTRSEMALPLFVKGRVVGALDVQSNQPNFFTEEDIKVLTTLAAQIGVAIDNAQLYEQSQNRANEMAFMFDVTTAAAAADSLADALDGVAKRLRDMFSAASVAIYLPRTYVDRNNDKYTVMQAFALTGGDLSLGDIKDIPTEGRGAIAQVVSQRQPLLIDLRQSQDYTPTAKNARSAVIVPLMSGLELVGVVAVESNRANAFNDDAINLLVVLGGSLSAIIQNAQLLTTLRERTEQLMELDRLKSDFLANMSHELRTPLNSIIGFSRVMLKGIDGPLTEMQEQDLTTIYNSGQLLLNLINDILDQAKIQSGKMDLKLDYFELKPVIESVRSIGIGFIKQKEKNLNITIDIAPNIPRAYGDEFRTRQVLNNLVSNAVKFTSEGTITIVAYPYTVEGRPMIRVDVTDSGIGIAEKDMPLLFEAFRQVDSSLTRTQGGTGLGLPISKSLVEMQGGEMMVESKVNQGSTFSITIPTEPVAETAEEPQPEDENAPELETDEFDALTTVETERPSIEETGKFTVQEVRAAIPPMKRTTGSAPVVKRHVLLIEDNPARVDQYRRALQREGFEVTTGDEPMIAMALATGLRPTLIILDVNFAKGHGWEMLRQLKDRDDTFDIPVLIATLSSESEKAYRMGAHTFLQHPFMPEELLEAVLKAEQESNTERILIIDDQPESVRLIEELLHEHGNYRVFSANNGQDGIALVARRRPDLVILDLRMPGMDGFAVLNELRSNPETATIPVLVVTGDTLNADEQDMLTNISVMPKADLSPQTYELFIKGVQTHLNGE